MHENIIMVSLCLVSSKMIATSNIISLALFITFSLCFFIFQIGDRLTAIEELTIN
jgi:hypothetical protein